jgi:hypothetical protein
MNKIHVVTYATHSDGLFKKLINNKFNIKIDILGWNTKWNGFYDKVRAIHNYSKKIPKNDLIIFLDGFDTIINKNIDTKLLETFNYLNCDILISKHPTFINQYITNKIFSNDSNDIHIANSGMYIGYADVVHNIFTDMLDTDTIDDQRALNICMKKYNYKIDIEETIFKNTFSNTDNILGKEYFISYPGASNATIIYKVKRYLRAIKDYSRFLKEEIIIIIIVILLLISYLYHSY